MSVTYYGFLYQGAQRSPENIAKRLVDDLGRQFVGHSAEGQWRLMWLPVLAGVELVVSIETDLLTDESEQQLGDLVLANQAPVRQMSAAETLDAIERFGAAQQCNRTRECSRPD